MTFLILSRKPEIYSTRRLVEEIQGRSHDCNVLDPEQAASASVDIVIPRLGQYRYAEALQGLRAVWKTHPQAEVLNPPEAFHRSRHKALSWQTLHEAHLPQPDVFASSPPFPVVVKDCLSSQGEGVFLCSSAEELQDLRARLQGKELLLQEWIAECAGRDVRAFVIGNDIAGAMERRAQTPGEFRSNLSLGGKGFATLLSEEERVLCLQAVQALGLDYAGVDFVRSHRGPLILEVNPCPGLEGIEKYSQRNIAKELVLYAEGLAGSHF